MIEILNSNGFQVVFPVVTPIVVSLIMFVFVEPLISRWKIRQTISAQNPLITIERIDTVSAGGSIDYCELWFECVNRGNDPIYLKRSYLYFNNKYWGIRKFDVFNTRSQEGEISPKSSIKLMVMFHDKYFEDMKKALVNYKPTMKSELKKLSIVFEDIEGRLYKKNVEKEHLKIINNKYKKYFGEDK